MLPLTQTDANKNLTQLNAVIKTEIGDGTLHAGMGAGKGGDTHPFV